jgi:acyl carrier protein
MTEGKESFWKTLPGILTGIAAIMSAGTGLYLALNRAPGPEPDSEPYQDIGSAPEPRGELIQPVIPVSHTSGNAGPCGDPSLPEVRRIVGEQLGANAQEIDVGVALARLPNGADDLDFVEIVMAIEEQCNVKIDDSEVDGLAAGTTVRELASVVDRKN